MTERPEILSTIIVAMSKLIVRPTNVDSRTTTQINPLRSIDISPSLGLASLCFKFYFAKRVPSAKIGSLSPHLSPAFVPINEKITLLLMSVATTKCSELLALGEVPIRLEQYDDLDSQRGGSVRPLPSQTTYLMPSYSSAYMLCMSGHKGSLLFLFKVYRWHWLCFTGN